MPRTRSMGGQTPELEEFHEELKQKQRTIKPAIVLTIQKKRLKKFRVPRVKLKNAMDRVLSPAPQREKTPMEKINDDIKNGETRANLRPVIILIDD